MRPCLGVVSRASVLTYVLSSGDPFAVRVRSATFRGTARRSG
jgi:hypothetical protein